MPASGRTQTDTPTIFTVFLFSYPHFRQVILREPKNPHYPGHGETVETVSDFTFGGSKITTDGDCSHEIKRRLLLGRKVMINLDSILKTRVITFPTKVHIIKVIVFPGVMYRCEICTVKKAKCKELMLLNCGAGEHSESLLECKEIQPVHPKGNQS